MRIQDSLFSRPFFSRQRLGAVLAGLACAAAQMSAVALVLASMPAAQAQDRQPVPYDSQQPPYQPYGGQPAYPRDDAYRPPARNEPYAPQPYGREPVPYSGEPQSGPGGYASQGAPTYGGNPGPGGNPGYGNPGYGQPYEPAPAYRPDYRDANNAPPPRRYDEGQPRDGTFSMHEITSAGHGFFGSISQGLASVIEHAFKRQGRPNGYILGEDIGGAFVAGLRYGEGTLHTKDAGHHKVYWQGPSIGYDAGAEGSKVMVLVYNLRDPDDLYHRFGGIAGSAYVIGGVGLTFQSHNDVVLAPIRSGIGLRLGANIGYLKYSRRPTWNPF